MIYIHGELFPRRWSPCKSFRCFYCIGTTSLIISLCMLGGSQAVTFCSAASGICGS